MDDPHTLVGKIYGGYLTTSTEVIASMKKEGKSALGVWVKGLQGSCVKVLPTEKLRASEPHERLIDVLNALALRPRKPPIQILDKAKQMRRSYAEYVKEHGLQCRPLVKHAVLALDKPDAKDVQKKKFEDCPGIVRVHTDFWADRCFFGRDEDALEFTIPPVLKR